MLNKIERAALMFPSAIVTIKELILWEYARLIAEETAAALGEETSQILQR